MANRRSRPASEIQAIADDAARFRKRAFCSAPSSWSFPQRLVWAEIRRPLEPASGNQNDWVWDLAVVPKQHAERQVLSEADIQSLSA